MTRTRIALTILLILLAAIAICLIGTAIIDSGSLDGLTHWRVS